LGVGQNKLHRAVSSRQHGFRVSLVNNQQVYCIKSGRSALLQTVLKGQASVCRLLLTHGANVNDVDRHKR